MLPKNTHVIVRADLNMPLIKNEPANLFRMIAFLPTLKKLLEYNNEVRIITHLGKPNAFSLFPSTKMLLPIFKAHGYNVAFAETINKAFKLKNQIVMVENIRFMPQEYTLNLLFAQHIKQLGTSFVQDAFASLHNRHASIVTLPTLFTKQNKTPGLLIDKELNQLDTITSLHQKNTVYLLSGGKIKKIQYVYELLNKKISILLGPVLCIPFLCLQYHKNYCCIPDKNLLQKCIIVKNHALFNTHIILPTDLLINTENKDRIINANSFSTNDKVLSIGPKTVDLFITIIEKAETIVVNGYMGFTDSPKCTEIMQNLLQKSFQKRMCLIGGGDTLYFIDSFTNPPKSIIRSTGGGAMLAYLTNHTLPGLQALF